MTSPEEQAVAFKNDGNKAFAAHDWPAAIALYTKAIELNDKEPVYYSNRAQVCFRVPQRKCSRDWLLKANIKSEAYGYAIADATKAIELDPKFVKVWNWYLNWRDKEEPAAPFLRLDVADVTQAYFRRAVAYTAILKSRDALKDFKTVVRLHPNDKDAKIKLAECEKIVKKVEFFRAIEVGDEPSAAEGLDLDSMVVEPEYDGVRLEKEMTPEFITDMLERFKSGKKIHKKYVYQIVIAVKKIVYDEATMVEIEVEDDAKLTVCGDTHGMWRCCIIVVSMLILKQVNTLILWSYSD
jgi:serine/threonine-protein phosphatase 5